VGSGGVLIVLRSLNRAVQFLRIYGALPSSESTMGLVYGAPVLEGSNELGVVADCAKWRISDRPCRGSRGPRGRTKGFRSKSRCLREMSPDLSQWKCGRSSPFFQPFSANVITVLGDLPTFATPIIYCPLCRRSETKNKPLP
jgi:hypothetical protein